MKNNDKGYSSVVGGMIAVVMTVVVIFITQTIHSRQETSVRNFKEEVEMNVKSRHGEERMYARFLESLSYKGNPEARKASTFSVVDSTLYPMVYEDLDIEYQLLDESSEKPMRASTLKLDELGKAFKNTRLMNGDKDSLNLLFNIQMASDVELTVEASNIDAVIELNGKEIPYGIDKAIEKSIKEELRIEDLIEDKIGVNHLGSSHDQEVGDGWEFKGSHEFGKGKLVTKIDKDSFYNAREALGFYGIFGAAVNLDEDKAVRKAEDILRTELLQYDVEYGLYGVIKEIKADFVFKINIKKEDREISFLKGDNPENKEENIRRIKIKDNTVDLIKYDTEFENMADKLKIKIDLDNLEKEVSKAINTQVIVKKKDGKKGVKENILERNFAKILTKDKSDQKKIEDYLNEHLKDYLEAGKEIYFKD